MAETIAVFIIAHEDLAAALLQTAEKIIGPQENVFTYSNTKESLPLLAEKIKKQLQETPAQHVVFFVDMLGGSCWALANMVRKEYPTIAIIAGINLPMLLSFFTNWSELSFTALVKKVRDTGIRGIQSLLGDV
jgi:mannose/fructose/sorbose-specific phosphotransferase system IIA component